MWWELNHWINLSFIIHSVAQRKVRWEFLRNLARSSVLHLFWYQSLCVISQHNFALALPLQNVTNLNLVFIPPPPHGSCCQPRSSLTNFSEPIPCMSQSDFMKLYGLSRVDLLVQAWVYNKCHIVSVIRTQYSKVLCEKEQIMQTL